MVAFCILTVRKLILRFVREEYMELFWQKLGKKQLKL